MRELERNRQLRVVITRRTQLDFRDGINIFIFSLADVLVRAGHDVTIIATSVGEAKRITTLFGLQRLPRLVALERQRPRLAIEGLSMRWLRRGRSAIARHEPDIVLNNGALPFRVPGHSCNLAHDLGWATAPRRLDALRRAYKRYSYRLCDDVVALSTEVRSGVADELGMPLEKIRVITPCADIASLTDARSSERASAILHTGTEAYKDPAATIRAFALMRSQASQLYVEGAVTAELDQQVMDLPVSVRSRIELVGELSAEALMRLLGSVRIAAFPTQYSVPTASATVVEAIGAATPIVGSRRISTDLLRDGHNGFVREDDEATAAAFERLLADEAEWESQSAAAAEIAPRFSPTLVASAYLDLLDEGIGSNWAR